MSNSDANKFKGFSTEVAKELQHYVYRLIDPRNGETFYVGKGKDNRVFAHADGTFVETLSDEEIESDPKLDRIRKIKLAGFDVLHVIHRHGMDSKTAYEVEGALIDAIPGLTNKAGGHHNVERGVAHASELIIAYSAEPAVIKHRILEITINRSAAEVDVYTATRFAWKLSPDNAKKAEVILAVVAGLVVEVFVASEWKVATKENFPERAASLDDEPDRYGFAGEVAPKEIREQYIHKKTPKKGKGAANPIRYLP